MGINLNKGESINLTKQAPGLKKAFIGAGWDVKKEGASMDADLSAFLVGSDGKVKTDNNFVYFGNKASGCGSVKSRGDNLTGAGEGDDEIIDVNLESVPADVNEIVFTVSIYQAAQKRQSLKDLDNAFVRAVNAETGEEIAKFPLSGTENLFGASLTFGKLVREGSDWNFVAVGQATEEEIGGLARAYGLAA